MPKLTKRKTGETFTFTTSKAMGKRIRHEAEFKGLSVSEFIRQVVAKQVSPNVPVEGSSFLAVDRCPENEFVTNCLGSAAGKTTSMKDVKLWRKKLSGDARSDGRKRVDTIDAGGAVVQSNFSTP